jgi:hypothetical protein
MSAGLAEIVGLTQSIAYAQHLAEQAGRHGPDGNEGYLLRLQAARVTGDGLTTGHTMQQAFAAAAAAATAHAAELDKQTGVQEQYDANPDAGDKDYYQAGGSTVVASGADDVPGLRARPADEIPPDHAASDEIPPQWPGHKPRRRWEWMVTAHQPGDSRNVRRGLPSVDLPSEQAIRTYVQAALQRYDWVELHHWHSGSELTFTRQPDGTVDVARRQLRPTDGAPGNQR